MSSVFFANPAPSPPPPPTRRLSASAAIPTPLWSQEHERRLTAAEHRAPPAPSASRPVFPHARPLQTDGPTPSSSVCPLYWLALSSQHINVLMSLCLKKQNKTMQNHFLGLTFVCSHARPPFPAASVSCGCSYKAPRGGRLTQQMRTVPSLKAGSPRSR